MKHFLFLLAVAIVLAATSCGELTFTKVSVVMAKDPRNGKLAGKVRTLTKQEPVTFYQENGRYYPADEKDSTAGLDSIRYINGRMWLYKDAARVAIVYSN